MKGILRTQRESKTMRQNVCSPSHPSVEPGPGQDCSSSWLNQAEVSAQWPAVSEPPPPQTLLLWETAGDT